MLKQPIAEEVKTKDGTVKFIWHPDKILDGVPCSQVYGFCSTAKGLVALVRDKDESRFTLPGGRVESGESADNALVREFIEEVQFRPESIKLLGSVEVLEADSVGNIIKRHQQVRFVCRPGEIKDFVSGKDGWETVERIFVPAEDLVNYLHWLRYPTGKAQFEHFIKLSKQN